MNEQKENNENSYAQKSILTLSFKTKSINTHLQSVIDELYFTPPFKIVPPFYDNEFANVMLLLVSAGLMAGDSQEMKLSLDKNCKVRLLSQSFEKIHNTNKGYATRQTSINVGENARLEYLPLPTIAFANSCFYNHTTITLHAYATLYYSEILIAGRIGLGEVFQMRCFETNVKLYKNNKLLYIDNMILEPHLMGIHTLCDFANFTHYLNMIIVDSQCKITQIQEIIQAYSLANNSVWNLDSKHHSIDSSFHSPMIASISLIHKEDSVYCLKALGHSSEELLALRQQICTL